MATGISEKLIHRHPHVFGDAIAENSDAVLRQWDVIKREEKGDAELPYLHGTGKGLPALLRAVKLQKKAAKVGFDWLDQREILSKIYEEIAELEQAIASQTPAQIEEELGDLLFSVVNLSRFRKIDPEILMARANQKFECRFAEMEKILKLQGKSLEESSLSEMEAAWLSVKKQGA